VSPDNHRVRNAYIFVVATLGLATLAWALRAMASSQPEVEWFLLAAVTLFTGSFTVKLPSLPAKISVSDTFVCTSTLLFGPEAGVVTVVLDALVISLWMDRSQRPPIRVLFNATAPAIAIWIAAETFFALAGVAPGAIDKPDVARMIGPTFAFALIYFGINSGLVAGALATERNVSVTAIWVEHFPPVSISYFVGSSIALLIVAYTDKVDLSVLAIIGPLLVISYLTFKTSMGRLEDTQRHVEQLNELYLSTVEALAMAVDAKDQITHGHIRRVQVYTVELAQRLGVRDREQLQAIEAAALLHDMGKLAIPEHILNKPGKLTPGEFATMKEHAAIGADLLSSVKFPYPVVPIVRHHHEQWDGKGYPTGISGPDIPLGARILSVVDCFDALTSDRPYRPRMTTEDAFAILLERRGSMYDPLVVDTFIECYAEIAPEAIQAGHDARGLIAATSGLRLADSAQPVADEPTTELADIFAEVVSCAMPDELLKDVAPHLQRSVPARAYALFTYDTNTDLLTCVSATNDPERRVLGLQIAAGERATGWCAANRRNAVNSFAELDLGQTIKTFDPPLRRSLSVPLLADGRCLGVLTAYSDSESAFSDARAAVLERAATLMASRLSSTLTLPVAS
jgi:putative nucleotidyltransferase with HDIG domain